MTGRAGAWWVVVLPGEYIETSDLFGLFRSEVGAQAIADMWNRTHDETDQAFVLPIQHVKQMK